MDERKYQSSKKDICKLEISSLNSHQAAVAQICLTNAWGGLEMSTVKFSRLFKKAGHMSFGISLKGSRVIEAMKKEGVTTLEIEKSTYFSLSSSLKIRRFVKENNIKAIYVHHLKDLWLLYPALWGLSKVRLLGFARMFMRNVNKKDFLHSIIYSRLNKLIALSNIQKQELMKCLPLPENKYIVIPNGVDTQRFNPNKRLDDIRKQMKVINGRDVVVGVIGRLDPQKGQLEFIEAAGRLSQRHENVRFVLVGQPNLDGFDYLEKINDSIKNHDLSDKVELLGHRKDTPELMASMDIFVLPSYEENFGNVILEAMASKLPIVATNTGGTPDIIKDGSWGKLIDAQSSQAIEDGIEYYLQNLDVAENHAKKAREMAEKELDINHVFERVKGLI